MKRKGKRMSEEEKGKKERDRCGSLKKAYL
jgi:hypothetical protein